MLLSLPPLKDGFSDGMRWAEEADKNRMGWDSEEKRPKPQTLRLKANHMKASQYDSLEFQGDGASCAHGTVSSDVPALCDWKCRAMPEKTKPASYRIALHPKPKPQHFKP